MRWFHDEKMEELTMVNNYGKPMENYGRQP